MLTYDKHMENENENSLLRETLNLSENENRIIDDSKDVYNTNTVPVLKSTRQYNNNNYDGISKDSDDDFSNGL